jgi:hypothetical protein
LFEFVQLGEGAVLLPMPETAAAPNGDEMTVEAIEIQNIEFWPFRPS